ncbi:MAG: PrsW family intramembrane metalloprotease [Thermoplasmatales archaeon]|nr:MAG: PrsW family intramembrane metalloprotease [Thermoplasmatales archaeon]
MKEWLLLVFMSFLPPLIYTIWIRNTEKYNREKWRTILTCFLWGASIAILAALIIEILFQIPLVASIQDYDTISFLTVIVVAPAAEEFTKPLALRLKSVRREIDEFEDGLILGAVAGLGFSATENLFYGWDFLQEGLLLFIILISIRSFGGCLLHASATALTGYGYGKTIMKHTSVLRIVPYFILAIFVHSSYNFLVSNDVIGALSGLFAALIFVTFTITLIRKKIISLDRKNR